MSMIYMPDIDRNSEFYNEYRGQDQYSIEDNLLVRIFPIYKNIDSNNAPTGGKRKIIYSLSPGEAMWQLTIMQSERLPQQEI